MALVGEEMLSLNMDARDIFEKLEAHVVEEAALGVPTLLGILACLLRISPTERGKLLQVLGEMVSGSAARSRKVPAPPGYSPPPPGFSPPSTPSTAGSRSPPTSGRRGQSGSPATPSTRPAAPPRGLAQVLADLANFSEQSRAAIVRAGGLTNLAMLLREGSAEERMQAMEAVVKLVDSGESQVAWIEADGVEAVVAAGWASFTEGEGEGAGRAGVAKALALLAQGSVAGSQAVLEAGGVELLVRLAVTSSLQICATAVRGLTHLVRHCDGARTKLVEAGPVPVLTRAVERGPPELSGAAVALLRMLADGDIQIQAAILAAGGLSTMVRLAIVGSPDSQRHAAVVLHLLALNFPEVRPAVAAGMAAAKLPERREAIIPPPPGLLPASGHHPGAYPSSQVA